MAQQLRKMDFFVQRVCLCLPAHTRQLTPVCSFSHEGANTIVWPPLVPGMQLVHTLAKFILLN